MLDRTKKQTEEEKPISPHASPYAWYWSPNSRYLLFVEKSPHSMGYILLLCCIECDLTYYMNRILVWEVYDTETLEVWTLHSFTPSHDWAGNYLPFFPQYAQNITCFSPDRYISFTHSTCT